MAIGIHFAFPDFSHYHGKPCRAGQNRIYRMTTKRLTLKALQSSATLAGECREPCLAIKFFVRAPPVQKHQALEVVSESSIRRLGL